MGIKKSQAILILDQKFYLSEKKNPYTPSLHAFFSEGKLLIPDLKKQNV